MENSIHHSDIIYKCLRALNLCQVFSHTTIRHVMAVLISTFSLGYKGKAVNFSSHSPCHRTTLAHFLNQGKWDSLHLEDTVKASVIQAVTIMLSCNGLTLNYAMVLYDKSTSKM